MAYTSARARHLLQLGIKHFARNINVSKRLAVNIPAERHSRARNPNVKEACSPALASSCEYVPRAEMATILRVHCRGAASAYLLDGVAYQLSAACRRAPMTSQRLSSWPLRRRLQRRAIIYHRALVTLAAQRQACAHRVETSHRISTSKSGAA